MKVKVFKQNEPIKLELSINEWLESKNNIDVKKIKYSTFYNPDYGHEIYTAILLFVESDTVNNTSVGGN